MTFETHEVAPSTQFDKDWVLDRLFDEDWYLRRNADVSASGLTAREHYARFGYFQLRDPSPFFSCSYYLSADPHLKETGTHPLDHYFQVGAFEDRKPHLYVCPIWLRSVLPDTDQEFVLLDYVENGGNLPPRPIFDIEHIRLAMDLPEHTSVAGVMAAFALARPPEQPTPNRLFDNAFVRKQIGPPFTISALDSYLEGKGRTASPHPLFINDYVWGNNECLRVTDALYFNELTLLEMAFLLKDPSPVKSNPLLDIKTYIANALPTYDAKVLPAMHYLKHGAAAGVDPNPYFDEKLYRARYLNGDTHTSGLEHYLANFREPHITLAPRFADRFYTTRYPEVAEHFPGSPLEHYISFGQKEFRTLGTPFWHDNFTSWDEVRRDVRVRAASLVGQSPDVSVVISAYNQFYFTLRCIWSLLSTGDAARLQVILVDDGSSDETQSFFCDLPGVNYIRNPSNLGFLLSCNHAAQKAVAPHLFFLNNDTAVLPGALDALLATMHALPDIGIVGSKLVYPDGTLQEAGGFIWNDGTGANLGRNSDPEEPAYNLRRDTDYISGAAILVPTQVWRDVGGFDERFAPAYCDDSDLAMRLRNLGYRVVYEPRSVVVHFEGVSSGTSTDTGVKSFQVINQKKLQKKWQFAMESHLAPQITKPRMMPRPPRPRILVIDAIVPEPDKDAGSVTAHWYLRLLVELGYDVTFIPTNLSLNGRYGHDLQRLGVEVLHAPYVKNLTSYLDTYGADFDLFLVYRVDVGGTHVEHLRRRFPETPVIFDTVDLHFLRAEREAKLKGGSNEDLATAAQIRERELRVMELAADTIILSSAEQDVLRDMGVKSSLTVIPLVLETRSMVPPRKGRTGIAFVGGFQHPPNVDAVLYFMERIWPILTRAAPELELHIVGSNAPASIVSISHPNVVVHGYVRDLDTFLDARIATIVPVQYGAGIKGKIGTSMAAGVPVVSTSVGSEGMGLAPGRDLLVADNPEGFVAAVLELCSDEALWSKLSRSGQAFVQAEYSADVTRDRLLRLLAKAGVEPFKGRCPISGQIEVRRFLQEGQLDSLAQSASGAWSSERVIAATLARQCGQGDVSLVRILPDTLHTAFGTLALMGDMPRLSTALAPLLNDMASAQTVVGRIVLDEATTHQTADLLRAIGPACTRLILACPSQDKRLTGKRQPPLHQARLVRQLEAAGWHVRSTLLPLKECALTGCNLVEARRTPPQVTAVVTS